MGKVIINSVEVTTQATSLILEFFIKLDLEMARKLGLDKLQKRKHHKTVFALWTTWDETLNMDINTSVEVLNIIFYFCPFVLWNPPHLTFNQISTILNNILKPSLRGGRTWMSVSLAVSKPRPLQRNLPCMPSVFSCPRACLEVLGYWRLCGGLVGRRLL